MSDLPGRPFTRRSFLVGAGALTLVACSSGGSDTATSTGSSPSTSDLVLGPLFASDALVPGAPQRMPFGLFNAEGSLTDSPPAELTFAVLGPDERSIGQPIAVA